MPHEELQGPTDEILIYSHFIEKSHFSNFATVGKTNSKPVMWRRKLLDDVVDFDESLFVRRR